MNVTPIFTATVTVHGKTERGDGNKRKRPWTTNVGAAVDGYEEGCSYKSFLPISEKEANTENTDISRVNYFANRTW